jgi:orotate phosphoribosyltransferase
MAGKRASLLRLLQTHAVLRGTFTLASGATSSYYLDARVVTLSARGSALIGALVLDVARNLGADAVAGLTLGADPIVSAVTTIAGVDGVEMDGLIVRREAKQHGAGRRIEGPWRDGIAVAIVDDTLTTGASALVAAEAILEAGGRVRGVIAVIDREQGAREAIEARGFPYQPLFAAREVIGET